MAGKGKCVQTAFKIGKLPNLEHVRAFRSPICFHFGERALNS